VSQIFYSRCTTCKIKIACYDSRRIKGHEKIKCKDCDGLNCPITTHMDSHGLCDNCIEHWQERKHGILLRKEKEVHSKKES